MRSLRKICIAISVCFLIGACGSSADPSPKGRAAEYLKENYIFDEENFTASLEEDNLYYYAHFCLFENAGNSGSPNSGMRNSSCPTGDVVVLIEKPSGKVAGAIFREVFLKRRQ